MSKNQTFSLKLMLTQQTSGTCIYQFQFWLPTEYLVDKWHNQYMDLVVFKYFCPLSVYIYIYREYDFCVQRHLCTKLVRRLCTVNYDVCVRSATFVYKYFCRASLA